MRSVTGTCRYTPGVHDVSCRKRGEYSKNGLIPTEARGLRSRGKLNWGKSAVVRIYNNGFCIMYSIRMKIERNNPLPA
jgi:hypothetical protein